MGYLTEAGKKVTMMTQIGVLKRDVTVTFLIRKYHTYALRTSPPLNRAFFCPVSSILMIEICS